MFYRRKILLSLIEVFGGSLSKTDCPKLLFLFCLRRGKNYYDFFPHKYGNFSFILTHDKTRLADLGFLTSHSDFQLKSNQSYIDQLEEKDRLILYALASEVGDLRGKELIRKVYLEASHYASRSEIVYNILTYAEYEQISHLRNDTRVPCLFTIGYEGLTIDAYLNILVSNHVITLVDVRKNPVSMKYGFSKTRLTQCLKEAGIAYIHIPDLGVPSSMRQKLSSEEAYQRLFDYYSAQILPSHKNAVDSLKAIVSDQRRVAITCFEADHRFCHRSRIASYLENDPDFDISIIHLHKDHSCSTIFHHQPSQSGQGKENGLYSYI